MLGRKIANKVINPKFVRALFLFLSAAILYVFLPRTCGAAVIPSEEVWKCAEHLGLQYNIDPLLIFSIACAESTLDAHADSGHARGIMQMSPDAWAEVTDRDFDEAWDWRENMEEAVCYLQLLKSRLLADDSYSWPVLVASYHYGLGKIEQSDYNLAKLLQPKNRIYSQLFNGETPDDLPAPAPKRPIEESPQVYRPDSNLILALDPSSYSGLPPLIDYSGEPIPDGKVVEQGVTIVLPELYKSRITEKAVESANPESSEIKQETVETPDAHNSPESVAVAQPDQNAQSEAQSAVLDVKNGVIAGSSAKPEEKTEEKPVWTEKSVATDPAQTPQNPDLGTPRKPEAIDSGKE